MDYEMTFRNWRWWLILPLAFVMIPFALVDMFSVYAVRPVWSRLCNWALQRKFS